MHADEKEIESEVASVGGRLEWATDCGVGVSFSRVTTDDALAQIPMTIECAVWINLANARITDVGLARLEGAALLESVGLVGTRVTMAGIDRLLAATPSVREVTISVGQFAPIDVRRMRTLWRNTRLVEG